MCFRLIFLQSGSRRQALRSGKNAARILKAVPDEGASLLPHLLPEDRIRKLTRVVSTCPEFRIQEFDGQRYDPKHKEGYVHTRKRTLRDSLDRKNIVILLCPGLDRFRLSEDLQALYMPERPVERVENRHGRIAVLKDGPVFQTALGDDIKNAVPVNVFKWSRAHKIVRTRCHDEDLMILNELLHFAHEFRLIHAVHRLAQLLGDLVADLRRCLFIFYEHARDRQVAAQSKFHVYDILREALVGKPEADERDPFADELFLSGVQEGLCLSSSERTVKIENKTESVIHRDVRRSFRYLADPDVAHDMSDRGRNALCSAHFSIV